MPHNPVLIVNPKAGSADERHALLELLPEVEVRETSSIEDAAVAVRYAAQRGADTVIAGGGDGTVRAVVDAIVSSAPHLRLGVLPMGTANTLCRSLSIPAALPEAVGLLRSGQTRSIDLVEMSTADRKLYYANLAHGGNSQRVIESLTADTKQRWGAWCYVRGALGILADLQGFPMVIQFDDQPPERFRVWNILLANARWAAGAVEVAPRADLEDGLLDVIVIQDGTPLDQARLTGEFLLGDYLEDPNVLYRQVRQVHVATEEGKAFVADGEVVFDPSILFRILPAQLRVIVGPDYRSGVATGNGTAAT